MIRARLSVLAVGALLAGVYLFASLVLPGGTKLLRESDFGPPARRISPAGYSGIFDLDVMRVVQSWTGDTTHPILVAPRTHVHPLSRLAVAPLGSAIHRHLAMSGLDSARVVVAVTMALNAVLTGWLAYQLAGAVLPGVAAALLYGVSFSAILLGAIPDSAGVSCLTTLPPLLYLNHRLNRRFDWQEAIAWGFLGVLCVGITISQIMHWFIALGVRLFFLRRSRDPSDASSQLIWKLAAVGALVLIVTAGAMVVQAWLYPETRLTRITALRLEGEQTFLRLHALRARPIAHFCRLLVHFAGYAFAAPFPGYSDYMIREWGRRYWSLSLEAVGVHDLHPLQVLLGVALAGLYVSAALSLRRVDRRFLAPALSIAGQFLLHLAYGREYILYSANWHGPVVAIVVVLAWRTFTAHERAFTACFVTLSLALAINNLTVLRRVYREVDFGLERGRRDAAGRPSRAGPRRDLLPSRPAGTGRGAPIATKRRETGSVPR